MLSAGQGRAGGQRARVAEGAGEALRSSAPTKREVVALREGPGALGRARPPKAAARMGFDRTRTRKLSRHGLIAWVPCLRHLGGAISHSGNGPEFPLRDLAGFRLPRFKLDRHLKMSQSRVGASGGWAKNTRAGGPARDGSGGRSRRPGKGPVSKRALHRRYVRALQPRQGCIPEAQTCGPVRENGESG